MDPFEPLKSAAKKGWALFGPTEMATASVAPRLVRFASMRPRDRVLDVACGTGVVALTAARIGAEVTGLDFTPELLARARENSAIMRATVTWREGDAEAIPYPDASFDVVVSQFGHIFAPRPEVVTAEMLRVLKPGGTIAFATWPPELLVGRVFALGASYGPPMPPGVRPPAEWGEPEVIRERLGEAVKNLVFDRAVLRFQILSPQHLRVFFEANVGPVSRLVEMLAPSDPARLAAFRQELEQLIGEYFEDNHVRQDFLLTRAVKR